MLSVIVPTRDRAELLELALHSLAQQTLSPSNFEIVVVDNGSRDGTQAVVAQFKKMSVGSIRYIYAASAGLHLGRHYGLREASGDIVVFIDDDIEAFPTFLATIAVAFENPQIALVGGKCLPRHEGRVPEWFSAMWAPNAHNERVLGYLESDRPGRASEVGQPTACIRMQFFNSTLGFGRSRRVSSGRDATAAHPVSWRRRDLRVALHRCERLQGLLPSRSIRLSSRSA